MNILKTMLIVKMIPLWCIESYLTIVHESKVEPEYILECFFECAELIFDML